MSKLLGIKLENFKSFKELDLPIPKGFTAIVGPNGAGKCLLGDTLLYLGNNKKVKFENLFENIKKDHKKKILEDGKEIYIPDQKIFVYSLNFDKFKIEKKPILAIIKRKEKKYAILKTKGKRSIKATLDHPFFILEDGCVKVYPLKNLRLGHKILVPSENFLKENFNFKNSFNSDKSFQVLENNLKNVFFSKDISLDIIESIKVVNKDTWVYDIQVKDHSNFIANEIIVHNSNIVDAFCFVLGKSSSKALRGKTFKDLITFLPKRPKEGRVILFFSLDEEEQKKLNSETKVLAIERKVFLEKDETSFRVYHIDLPSQKVFKLLKSKEGSKIFNFVKKTKKVSKSEANDILNKINLAMHAPNIILQGDLLKVISMTNLERRKIIDEICGIWEFEEKKQKALEELKNAKEYLEKIQIRLQELKSLLDHLNLEVEKLEKYENYKSQISLLTNIYYLRLYLLYKNRNKKLKETIKDLKNKFYEIRQERESLKESLAEKEGILKEIENKIDDFKKNKYQFTFENYSKLKLEIEHLEKEINKLKKKITNLENQINFLKKEKIKLSEKLKFTDHLLSEKKVLYEKLNDKLKVLEKELEQKSKDFLELSQYLEELSQEEKSYLEKKSQILSEIKDIENKIKFLDNEKINLEKKLKELKEKKEDILAQIRELQNKNFNFKSILDKLEEIKDEKFSLKEEENRLREEIRFLELEREEILRKYYEEEAKIKSLEKLSLNYDKAIEKLFQANLPGIIDIVGNLGKTLPKYKLALEASAGGKLNFVVVETFEDAKRAINFLKEKNLGRLTFLPLDTLRYRETPLLEHPKIIGRAIDLIDFDEKYRPIFEFIFFNTYVVKNLDDAKELFQIYRNSRFVTLDGDILEPSGAVSGGKFRPRAQISVKIDYSLLNDLKKRLENLSEKLSEKKEKLQDILKKIKKLEKDEITLKYQLQNLERQKKETLTKLEKLKSSLENIELNLVNIKKSIISVENEKNILENLLNDKQSKLNNILKILENIEKKRNSLKNSEALKEIENLKENISKTKKTLKNLEKEINSLSLEKEKYIFKLSSIEEKLKELSKEKEILEKSLKLNFELLEQKKNKFEKLSKELDILKDTLRKLEEEKENILKEIEKIKKKLNAVQDKLEEFQEKIFNFEKEKEKILTQLNDLKKFYPEIEFYKDISSKEDIINILKNKGYKNIDNELQKDLEELEKEIKILKEKQKALEPINFQAKKDYEEIYERYKVLLEKYNIYKKEEEKYLSLLEEIEKRKKEVFLNTFEKIRKNFKEIYEKLGGKGDIVLENDKDIFKGGIIIKATPKGKRLINMNAMSGGEKALAALSFIFAIAKLYDAPFYILDEVDAPLDVKNASLVGKLIKNFSKDKDFIVISHREQTISSADYLFGVIMENGLSKVVGIKT
ncbi:MAG TPA: hypothetical protein EYH39_04700 [Desulfurobacteriaceae bacterium]|nr:hypothetical protein [Desulfurobacteriaceae bacterium]